MKLDLGRKDFTVTSRACPLKWCVLYNYSVSEDLLLVIHSLKSRLNLVFSWILYVVMRLIW